jgi:hypothetical protein
MQTTNNKKRSNVLLWILLPAIPLVATGVWIYENQDVPIAQGQRHERYQCPMHPQIVQDHPGECPICHMKLEKVDDADATIGPTPTGGQPALGTHHDRYQCPMHPQIIQDHPGECPICHMQLQKVEDDTAAPTSGSAGSKVVRYRNPMDPTVFSDRPTKDSMGMDYIPVYQDQAGDGNNSVAGKSGFTLSPERQQLIGVRTTMAEVKPIKLTVRMPGRASSGDRVLAQLLEIDAGTVKDGMKARLSGPNGSSVDARVVGIGASLDNLTHSFVVTVEASAPADWLRPGFFCEVEVTSDLGSGLAVPQEAVLDTGERKVLFIDDNGHFEPREVVLGRVGDDLVEVKTGLKAGDQVVTSANFLIDSESRFRAALNQL